MRIDDSTGAVLATVDAASTARTTGTIVQAVQMVNAAGQVGMDVKGFNTANFTVHLDAENVGATTGYMLIDLSNTTNWPHTLTDFIVIEAFDVDVNPDTNFRGEIEFGFLSSVDATNGDFNVLATVHLERSSTNLSHELNAQLCHIHCKASNCFGPVTANDVTWQTDVNLIGPPGGAAAYPAGDGDLVMKITQTAGNVDVGVVVLYHTE